MRYMLLPTLLVLVVGIGCGGGDNGTNPNPNQPPAAAFSGTPTSGAPPLTVTFTDASTNTPSSWVWTFGDSDSSTLQNPTHIYTADGAYTVTLTATNAHGSDSEIKSSYITVTTALAVTAATPTAGSISVPAGAAITATFSKDMNASTITAATFTLDNGATGTVTYVNRVATFTPTTPLKGYTRYTAVITTGAKDMAGNALAQNYSWSFSGASLYFPMAEGDTWYFTAADMHKVKRTVSGDTTIITHVCKRVLENDTTAEAWFVDSTGFYVHLLDGILRAEPPLKLPYHMAVNQVYSYAATLYWTENDTAYSAPISGDLKYSGYVSRTVPAGTFPDAIKFLYITDGYSEYYVEGLGLIDNEDYVLDSAFVGGVWYRP